MEIAVVGCGWWGKNIINTFEEIARVNKVHIYDLDKESYTKFNQNKKVVLKDSLGQIFNDPSILGVCISTPPQTHYELSKLFLQQGKNILIEKPPAYELSQVRELWQIAKVKKLVYMLDALYLFQEPVIKMKEIIEAGVLKNIKYIQMFRIGDELRRTSAGLERIKNTMFKNGTDVVEDLFLHDAGILIHLLGKVDFKSVEKLFLYDERFCDTARIKFAKNNIDIEITISWTLTGRRRGIVIYDKDYIVEFDALKSENQVSIYTLDEMRYQYLNFPNHPPLKGMLEYFTKTITNGADNFLDYNFMISIMELWEEIKNAE